MSKNISTSVRNRKLATVLYGSLPLLALAFPAAAQAQTASNTASITLPAGVTDPFPGNNSATDTDDVLAALVAVNDSATGISAAAGAANVLNVFTGDTVNGNPADTGNADLYLVPASTPTGITFDTATGNVSVAAGTAPGDYSFDYRLCEEGSTTNCVTATVSLTVDAVITPVTESGSGTSGTASTVIANVRSNDSVNGSAADATNSTISQSGTWPTGITLNTTTGAVDITGSVAPGTYAITYELCDLSSPTPNCATVEDTVTVAADIVPVTESGSGTAGTASTVITNVRSNDTVNGAAATSSNSTISQSGTWPTGITLNTTTGAVDITGSVAPGTYAITYELCDLSSPTPNCATVEDSVTIAADIVPVTESGSGTSGTASTVITNVRSNDTVNGSAATSSNSTISQSGTWPTGITLNTTTGAVDITGSVAPGTYAITYELCDLSSPTPNCATVEDTVTVAASIVPVTESGTGKTGAASTVIADVRSNDTVNGSPATGSNSTISQSGTWQTGISLDTTSGAISIDATVAPGTYPVTYELCDLSSPTPNCATMEDTVTVTNRQADISLNKSNGVDEVTSGQTISYTLTISNSGPDSVTGVVVNDSPGAGLTCPAGNPLTFGGAAGAIPAGPFTISNLTGSGVTLGTLENGESVTVTYSCTVN